MVFNRKRRIVVDILLGFVLLCALGFGIALGVALAVTSDTNVRKALEDYNPSLPSQILDRNGNLISELFSDQKRKIVSIDELPKHLVYATITREDDKFFEHRGFDLIGTARALFNALTGQFSGGASTITQQVAGRHFADRAVKSYARKLKELWWSFQLERALTKNEILELYLNHEYFGHNCYGVEEASKFYFGHSAAEITLAESAILVIQLSNPANYSPINHPDVAQKRQSYILDRMVKLGYATEEEANSSFDEYWASYDWSRSSRSTAYYDKNDRAPYFSEYVRLQLDDMLFGEVNYNTGGLKIYTTLDLGYQDIADKVMDKHIHEVNLKYTTNTARRLGVFDEKYLPIIDLFSLAFGIEEIRTAGSREKKEAQDDFYEKYTPMLEMMGLVFGSHDFMSIAGIATKKVKNRSLRNRVEGALITIENNTGHILAMVGGSDWETKKFNRATQANVQPGSSFKPLYYSAAISSRRFTTATRLPDMPVAFYYEDDRPPYTPENFLGTWQGSVLLRYALATSMNVPSIQVLDGIGFEAAIDRASKMLGMEQYKDDPDAFPRVYPFGLGIVSVAPINMARAFATFPSQGKVVEPIAIIRIEDRNGEVIEEPERDRIRQQKNQREENQIMTPQEAYIMTDILQSTVEYGTLARRRQLVGGFGDMPMAGKTGTTQNWSDAWTVGFSPYMTTALWLGFDVRGNSLGRGLTGATAAGPAWAEYMKIIHGQLPPKEFPEPETGIIRRTVCSVSGLLPTEDCDDGTREEIFLIGTEPKTACDIHVFQRELDETMMNRFLDAIIIEAPPSSSDYDFPELISPDSLSFPLDIDGELEDDVYVDENDYLD